MKYGLNNWCNSQQTKPATFSLSSFSRTPNLRFAFPCPSYFLTKPLWNVIMDFCVPLRLSFCQCLVVFGQNEIAKFLAKAASLFCAFRGDPSLILPRRSQWPQPDILDVAHLEMQYFTHFSNSHSPFGAIIPVLPHTSCKVYHLCCYGQSLI